MEKPTQTTIGRFGQIRPWQGGVLTGLLGGLVMGVLLTLLMRSTIETAIPALWTLDGGAAGWTVHMVNSAIFGVVFAAIAVRWPRTIGTLDRAILSGAAYGAALWIVGAGLVMPVWLDLAGFASPPAIPNLEAMSLLVHLVFGIVLGAALSQVLREPPTI